jgi:CRP-like cAMP-binding protein
MTRGPSYPAEGVGALLVRRYSTLAPLTTEDVALLKKPTTLERLPAGAELETEGAAITPRFLVSGWAARFRLLADGRRQIVGILLPSDALGVGESRQPVAFTSCVALTYVALADAAPFQEAISEGAAQHRALREAIRAAKALETLFAVNHVVRNGRQTAYERICHLVLELQWRLNQTGLAEDGVISWPLTQEVLADTLGLSIVHVNRMLQQLRRDGVMEVHNGVLRILKPATMADVAEFKPPAAAPAPNRTY